MNVSRKLDLEELVRLPDGGGGFIGTWTRVGMVWGKVEPRSAGLSAGEEAATSLARYRITVRAAPVGNSVRPKPGQRFREGVRIFAIRSVQDARDTQFLTCSVEEEVAS